MTALKQHPLSAAFPAMLAEEFQELRDSINIVGVLNAITLLDGMVLDGWHQVLELHDCTGSHAPGMMGLRLRRWGLDDQRQPFDDGHTGPSHDSWYTGTFRPVGHRAWRIHDEPPWCGLGPIYFKTIDPPIMAGQLNLFS